MLEADAGSNVTAPRRPFPANNPMFRKEDGVAFVNDFLKQIEDAGLWTQLWQISLGDRTGGAETVPEPPVIGE